MSTVPNYKIDFKSESKLMKTIGKVLFFNKSFMTNFTTTLGRTIYFPDRSYLKNRPVTSKATLVHELVHVKDYEKYGPVKFILMYGSPQILSLFTIPLFFFAPWYIALICFCFCLFPLPAYFRMKLEEKAYTFSVYSLYKLTQTGNKIDVAIYIDSCIEIFKSSDYYFMWPFYNSNHLKSAFEEFKKGNKPFYEQEYYDMADEVLNSQINL